MGASLRELVGSLRSETVVSLEVGAGLLLVVVAAVCALVIRRWVLTSMRGAFDCHLRLSDSAGSPDGGWRVGVARYQPTMLTFFTTVSLTWWPTLTFDRARLAVVDRRSAGDELPGVVKGIIVRCRFDDRPVELAMDERTAGAFDVWVQAVPPSRGTGRV